MEEGSWKRRNTNSWVAKEVFNCAGWMTHRVTDTVMVSMFRPQNIYTHYKDEISAQKDHISRGLQGHDPNIKVTSGRLLIHRY